MNTELFNGLVNGLNEYGKYLKGENTNISVYNPVDVKAIRKNLKLSQTKFAEEFGININTLRGWEQGKRGMDTTTMILLNVINQYPDIVKKVVQENIL